MATKYVVSYFDRGASVPVRNEFSELTDANNHAADLRGNPNVRDVKVETETSGAPEVSD